MRKILVVSSISIALFVASFSLASAQSLPGVCSVLPLLEQGSTGSTVTLLQQFLGAQGDLNVAPTGFFGPLTETALVQFQIATGISAQAGGNGLFGQFTRAYILSHFCQSGGTFISPPAQTGLLTVNVTSGEAPLTVTFSGIGSTINFGDGSNQTSQNGGAIGSINHTYTAAGNYVATSGNLQVTISVSGNATTPAGSISSFTDSGPAPLTVTFYVSCTNASTYDVSYGDGTDLGSSNASQVLCNGSLESFTHTYSSAGSYTATLDLLQQQSNGTFVTQTGGTVGINATGASNNSNNSVSFTASPASGSAPLAVTFSAVSATNLSGDTVTFGDGTSGTMAQSACSELAPVNGGSSACSYSVSHTYSSAGTFPATLTGNGSTLGTASVTVSGSSLTATPSAGAPPLAVQFSYPISAGQINNSFSINFGDGQSGAAQAACANDGPGGCSAQEAHTYTATGTYPAVISSGGINLATTTVSVGSCVVPSQALSLGDTDADSGGQVTVLQDFLTFEGPAIYPGQLVTGFFGNATLTGVRNFQAAYNIEQTGFVGPLTLAAIAQVCASGGVSGSGFSFAASPSSGNPPLSVTFTATNAETASSGAYLVDFGDGSQGTMLGNAASMSTSHTYQQSGTYNAVLEIQQNLCGGDVALLGCISDLQVGTTTVTVGSGGSTPPPASGTQSINVYSIGGFGCDSPSNNSSNCAASQLGPLGNNSVPLETFQVFGSQQAGTVPLYVCDTGYLGNLYGAVSFSDQNGSTSYVPTGQIGGTPTTGSVCLPGDGTIIGGNWGYIYRGAVSGALPLDLLSYTDNNGSVWYMMTTIPWDFPSAANVGVLGYVPSSSPN